VKSVAKNKGKVYLVGAGPGDPDLITVRGAELLGQAECIIYDRLANPALLKFARKDAEIIHVPKRIGNRSFTQDDVNKLLLEKASAGKTVVRLKGGDPCIFARGGEEARLLADAGIDFEIVPGVTAAIAAAEYSGILLTDRDYSSQVVFITGQEAPGKEKSNIDWSLLAKFPGTIVFYMAMGNLESIAQQLIENGMAEGTPTAVISDATFPNQRIIKSSLTQIAAKCTQENIEPPAIVVIGTAADSDPRLNWFMNQPLFGRNIVVTRDVPGNADFAAKIIRKGGNPIDFPTIKIKPLTHTNIFVQALARIPDFDWLIFTSRNGVTVFFDSLHSLNKDARVFGSAKIASMGSKTADELSGFGINPDFVPTVFTSAELGKQLIRFTNLQGKKILLLRSELASQELVHLLKKAGADIHDVPLYTIEKQTPDSADLIQKIKASQIHWLTFASPSSVRIFFEQISAGLVNSADVKVASIGPVTSSQLKDLGVKVDLEAPEHTIAGLLASVEKSERLKA